MLVCVIINTICICIILIIINPPLLLQLCRFHYHVGYCFNPAIYLQATGVDAIKSTYCYCKRYGGGVGSPATSSPLVVFGVVARTSR